MMKIGRSSPSAGRKQRGLSKIETRGTRFGTLGILWIIYGIVMIMAAAFLVVCNGIGLPPWMWGAIVTRVPLDEHLSSLPRRDSCDGAHFSFLFAGRGIRSAARSNILAHAWTDRRSVRIVRRAA